ncbi:MAG: recombination protein O N-terminal domain-containing protein [Candidatus Liptonbacteria bacterium]|nr:recombination protein O N-terminal domain-containing protein [Candidatus Liptonbacteria bacterium]
MLEYVDDALVLDKEPNGDLDVRVSLFTRRYGKLVAKAKSARKITSKLSSHLEPGNLVSVRLVEKNGLQAVDALKVGAARISPPDLYLLHSLIAEHEPDGNLWAAVSERAFSWSEVLKVLGWDPQGARCEACGAAEPKAFHVATQRFACRECAARINRAGDAARRDIHSKLLISL